MPYKAATSGEVITVSLGKAGPTMLCRSRRAASPDDENLTMDYRCPVYHWK